MRDNGLDRFYEAHRRTFSRAFTEIQNGRKESHWMWYIFPQIRGLGKSETAQYYAISDIEEAEEFLNDAFLGENLRMISKELLSKPTNDAQKIFGYIDAVKLKSSMTLFHIVGGSCDENRVFCDVLSKFFNAELDKKTLKLIGEYEA